MAGSFITEFLGELVVGDGSHGWYAVQLKSVPKMSLDAGRPKSVQYTHVVP